MSISYATVVQDLIAASGIPRTKQPSTMDYSYPLTGEHPNGFPLTSRVWRFAPKLASGPLNRKRSDRKKRMDGLPDDYAALYASVYASHAAHHNPLPYPAGYHPTKSATPIAGFWVCIGAGLYLLALLGPEMKRRVGTVQEIEWQLPIWAQRRLEGSNSHFVRSNVAGNSEEQAPLLSRDEVVWETTLVNGQDVGVEKIDWRSSSTHSRGSDRSRDGARDQDSGSPGPNQTAPQARISTRPGSELFLPTSPMVPSYRHLYPHVQDSPTEIMIRDMSGIHFAIPKESFGQPVKGARPGSLPRAATAPAALPAKARGKSTTSNGGSSRGAGVRLTSSKKQGVRPTRIDKDATTARRISRRQTEIPTTSKSFVPHSPEDSPVEAPRDSRQNYMLPMPWRRRRKGETMSMLVDAGFFPVQELIYAPGDDLQELSEGDGAVNASSTLSAMDSAIARLSAIPEDGAQQENEPLAEPVATEVPVATEIHLATGTVVTVRPPELTAWQRSIYLEGPIKLPKPALLPRKGSIASLEPFQEAVDRVYQDALIMPRRKGDNAVVDDICEWFDEFGLGCGSFDHDRFDTFEDEDAGAALMARLEILSEEESKRLSLPPAEQGAEARDEIIGRLADQPELTVTSTGREMVRVTSFSEGPGRDVLLNMPKGSQMYLDADAKMDTFQTQDGSNQTRLNLIQRHFEALSRPRSHDTSGAESHTSAAEEPLSGIGQS
ncbi:hypothetical protein M8818_002742 [Zalaria obscura]|uniref:Uncharacterized protein n=1 Tax=Zalaria obscura TaxID=2024903 RepID=A0ACC3SHC7_9PEZI